jgi:protein-tyrosine-phosphatase
MAAALLRHYAGETLVVRSAGSTPAEEINPAVVQAMAELGIDLFGRVPTKLTESDVSAADVVITMGCGDACPIYPGKRYLDWDIPDPAGLPIERVRPIRDEIDARVRQLQDRLARQ